MSNIFCANCGAQIVEGARYCRRCGVAAPSPRAAESSEAVTRTFVAAEPRQTRDVHAGVTAPAYLAPPEMSAAEPASQTRSLAGQAAGAKSSRKFPFVILAGLVLLVLGGLVAAGISSQFWGKTAVRRIVKAKDKEKPAIPPVPPAPPKVGPVAPAPDLSALTYPGSEVRMNISGGDEGGVLQLHTEDAFDKVAEWYAAKLDTTSRVFVKSRHMVLEKDGTSVVISGKPDGTNIILSRGGPRPGTHAPHPDGENDEGDGDAGEEN